MFQSNINLNFYKTFYAVAKYGSFFKASECTFTSQPAISKSIKKLEKELNTYVNYYLNIKSLLSLLNLILFMI